MKKTSLRKNRFSAKRVRLPDNSPKRKLSRKLWRSRSKRNGTAEEGESLMELLAFNDRDIVALIKDSMSRPISAEAQAFYDRMYALTHGGASMHDNTDPDRSDAA